MSETGMTTISNFMSTLPNIASLLGTSLALMAASWVVPHLVSNPDELCHETELLESRYLSDGQSCILPDISRKTRQPEVAQGSQVDGKRPTRRSGAERTLSPVGGYNVS